MTMNVTIASISAKQQNKWDKNKEIISEKFDDSRIVSRVMHTKLN